MSGFDEQVVEDGVFEEVEPACVAMVPLAPAPPYWATQIFEPTSRSNFRCASDRDRRTASANPQPAARNARGRAVRLPRAGAQCARCRSADPANNLMEKDRR